MDEILLLALIGLAVYLISRQQVNTETQTMQMSAQGKADLIRHEGIRYTPYKDSAGYWTVGIGHLIVPGDGLATDRDIDENTLMAVFQTDLSNAESAVNRNINVPLTQGQYDALVDWTFQYGGARLAASTLRKLINNFQYEQAALEFPKWVYVGKPQRIEPGLVARRQDNLTTYMT